MILALGYALYGRSVNGPGGGWPQGGPAPVSVAEVIEREVRPWQEFSGRLVAVDQVDIRPRVAGTIEAVHFTDGAEVREGDLLFTIDPRPFEAALDAAQAAYRYAELQHGRAAALLKDKAISRREADEKQNALQQAKSALTRARLDIGYTAVRSPIGGRAGRPEITAGNLVEAGPNAPVLTTIVDSAPIYADFEMDEASYLKYAQGSARAETIPVQLLLSADRPPVKGTIKSFDNRLDAASGTIRVRAIFANDDGRLVPGLFARIRLGSAAPAKALLITDRAVGTDQSKKFVLVVGEGNKVEYREVTLGAQVEGLRVVEAGLKAGEKIVVGGTQRARPGSEVVPEIVPMDPS